MGPGFPAVYCVSDPGIGDSGNLERLIRAMGDRGVQMRKRDAVATSFLAGLGA